MFSSLILYPSLCTILATDLLVYYRVKLPEEKEKGNSDNSYEDDETSPQQSMECDSVIDVTEDDSSEQYVEQDQSVEDNNISSTNNTGIHIHNVSSTV